MRVQMKHIPIILITVVAVFVISYQACEKERLIKTQQTYVDSMRVYHAAHNLNIDIIKKIDSLGYLLPKHSEAVRNYITNYTYEIKAADTLLFDSLAVMLRADIESYVPR